MKYDTIYQKMTRLNKILQLFASASIFMTTTATASQQSTGLSGDIDTAKMISTCSYEHESDSSFPRTHHRVGSTTVLYYYDKRKERIIYLLLHILFILGLISIYMDNLTYYVITALTSITAFLLINDVTKPFVFIFTSINNIVVDLLHVCSSKRKLLLSPTTPCSVNLY